MSARKRKVAKPVVSHSPSYIQYNGKVLDLFPFQAILLGPLVKAFGSLMPTNAIIERGYQQAKQVPHPAIKMLLPTEMVSMDDKLRHQLGLTIKHVEGTGYILTESNIEQCP